MTDMTEHTDDGNTGGASITNRTTVHGKIRVRSFDEAALRGAARDRGQAYDDLSKPEKLALAETVDPATDATTENVTLQQFHEHLVDLLDPGTAVTTPFQPTHLAVGTDPTPEDHTQTGLVSEYDRFELTRTENEGDDLYTSVFLDTAEANADDTDDLDLHEVMLTTDPTAPTDASELNLNRAVIPDLTKNNLTTATIEITLQFRP